MEKVAATRLLIVPGLREHFSRRWFDSGTPQSALNRTSVYVKLLFLSAICDCRVEPPSRVWRLSRYPGTYRAGSSRRRPTVNPVYRISPGCPVLRPLRLAPGCCRLEEGKLDSLDYISTAARRELRGSEVGVFGRLPDSWQNVTASADSSNDGSCRSSGNSCHSSGNSCRSSGNSCRSSVDICGSTGRSLAMYGLSWSYPRRQDRTCQSLVPIRGLAVMNVVAAAARLPAVDELGPQFELWS